VAEFKIEGKEAFFRKLEQVTGKVATRGARTAASRAMRPVRDLVKARWAAKDDPSTPTSIAKNVALSSRYYPKLKEARARVGIRGGARVTKDPANTGHWRFLELGTSEIPADPVMVPALRDRTSEVANTFFSEMEKEIDKAVGP
jgi:HK97 gp10 family phage protein